MESNKDEIVSRMKKEYEKQLEYELKNLQSDIAQINQSSTYKDVLKEREARMQQTLDLFKSKQKVGENGEENIKENPLNNINSFNIK